MKNKILKYLYWLLAIFPFILSAIFYSRLPDQVAIHWDAAGQVTRYVSRPMAAFGVPALLLVCILFVNFCISADPQKQNIDRSPQLKFLGRWMIVLLANVMQSLTILNAFQSNRVKVIFIVVGVLFIIIGNYLPKCKYNYTIGIKLPWTLASEENWRRTHRFAGFFWVISGVLMAVNSFFAFSWISFTALALMVVVPSIYSYCFFLKERKEKSHD